MTRQVLLFENAQGATVAVVCNSPAAADKIRDVSSLECLGTVPVISFVEATVGT